MTEPRGYFGIRFADLDWEDGQSMLGLPEGVQVKILRRYPPEQARLDFLVKFPPGYQEPRLTASGSGMGIVLEGRQIVDEFGPGTYTYDIGTIPHGPFDYPDGCVLFVSMHGGTVHEFDRSRTAG